ncbi:MAG: hypothetical protein OXD32_07005 [Endozoicomonadaceae bacterium]|nr:hypothetical protein [Endozoicomonadaceae bacterium]MCY4328979.1 hypothetical protein [Endozoicomonadaceae bacterium]
MWDSLYGKYEPIKKSKLEKLLSFFFKTPDDERNKLYVALKKAFTPGLWFKKAANPQEQEKTKLTLKDPVSEGNKEEVTEYYDRYYGE